MIWTGAVLIWAGACSNTNFPTHAKKCIKSKVWQTDRPTDRLTQWLVGCVARNKKYKKMIISSMLMPLPISLLLLPNSLLPLPNHPQQRFPCIRPCLFWITPYQTKNIFFYSSISFQGCQIWCKGQHEDVVDKSVLGKFRGETKMLCGFLWSNRNWWIEGQE